ncbi:GTPase activating protein, putative [Entamoeba invadens IP1]|uniref:GTPase activating protein, putative n=1 Tax=Entamoeba invadens IP1 TaxID=370355 RepID=A0A0A1U362_ENTIV|nr:GTPase activating protein, putative [Entamoeba invadens IP1]ELP88487.1 GTPase activating protein, putative [Entamoeba invadens IP1]|eukprot:XP_004255258.1 GTPase activating protein, putative [Entamoeba invadens IP1]
MGGSKSKPINYAQINLSTKQIDLTYTTTSQPFTIQNDSETKIKYSVDDYTTADYTITFAPKSGQVSPHTPHRITVTVVFKQKVNVVVPFSMHIAAKSETFNVRLRGEDGVFGVDPSDLEWVTADDHHLPKPLSVLNENFMRLDGFRSEGVFRLAGQSFLMKEMKGAMNTSKGELVIEKDFSINEVANLIKLWFRELPTLCLNPLSSTQIQAPSIEECWNGYCTLPQMNRDLLDWLFALLIKVSKHKDENKMTLQNLAIVVAPNLYEANSRDQMEMMMMSQKAVQFVHNVLLHFEQTVQTV